MVMHLPCFAREMEVSQRDMATMTRDVAFMIRRQYGDIDSDVQELKSCLGAMKINSASSLPNHVWRKGE